jgi:hypothetical protein
MCSLATDNPILVSVEGNPMRVSTPDIRGTISPDEDDPEAIQSKNVRPGDPASMPIAESILMVVPVEFSSLFAASCTAVSCPTEIFAVVSS